MTNHSHHSLPVHCQGRLYGHACPPGADTLLSADLAQCASGDIDAFSRVYDATIGRLYNLALAATGGPEEAEIVIRRTYLEAWNTVARFNPQRRSAAAWLAIILCHHASALTRPTPP